MNSPSSVPTVLPALGRWLRCALGVLALVPALWGLLALSPATPTALAATRTWFVAPSGTDAACTANSSSTPFATIQTAIHCAAKGDVIVLASSGSTPYPGIGTVDKNLTIEAASGANARTVAVDLAKPADANGFSAGLVTVPAGVTARIQGVSLECASGTTGCLSQTCETTSCVGSLVTNHGVLTLMGVLITGAQHGAINNVSGAGTQANLTVTSSTIAHNTNDTAANDSQAAGISSTRAPGSPDAKVTVQNSTLADNAGTLGTPAGAIYTNEILAGAIALTNDTIANNSGTAGGGISTPVGFTPVIATNTIVAANTASDHASSGPDCLGPIADGPGGHNLIGDNTNCSGVSNGVNGDLVEVSNPGLNPLANKSGSTDTVSLQPQSPAIGSGDVTTCQSKLIGGRDERGVSRKATTRGCDIGAYDTAGSGGVAVHTWYVGPNGKASSCSANTSKNKFATVQSAIACASDGDVIVLAASGSTPYPGVGTVGKSVTIEAASGANASSVVVELSNPSDAKGFSAGLVNIPSSASVKLQNLGLQCTESSGHLCMSQTCETTHCEGSLVTNNGALSLTGVSVTGAKHGAGINDVSTGQAPARLTVAASTVAHNANDDTANDASAAGISARAATVGAADPQVTITNSTIDDNSGQSDAGGILIVGRRQTADLVLINDTITGNTSAGGYNGAGGVASAGSPALASNTVIAGNTTSAQTIGANDCFGMLGDGPGGHNLIGDGSSCTQIANGTNGDRVGTPANPLDPKLAALAFNGGATQTNALLTGSPLFAAGDVATCTAGPVFGSDQRGQARNAATRAACDIGAYDTGGSAPA
jgi:hypothetical protein